jgi:hypothetical protein
MPGTPTPILPQTVRSPAIQITNANGTTVQNIFTAGANGSLISAISVASSDTTARDLRFFVNNGTADVLLCTVSIPASAGNSTSAFAVDVFRATACPGLSFDANGNRQLFLQSGHSLRAAAAAAVTSGQAINIICPAVGDY